MKRDEPAVHVRRVGTGFCGKPEVPRMRPSRSLRHGQFTIKIYRHLNSDTSHIYEISAYAFLKTDIVGYMKGYWLDLLVFRQAEDIIWEMDPISQTTLDAAYAIHSIGTKFWRQRDLLLFFDTAEILPLYRLKGLARTMAHAVIDSGRKQGRRLDIFLQPYPLEIESVDPDEVDGRPMVTQAEWDAEIESIRSCWLKVLPSLRRSVIGGLNGDRDYYFAKDV